MQRLGSGEVIISTEEQNELIDVIEAEYSDLKMKLVFQSEESGIRMENALGPNSPYILRKTDDTIHGKKTPDVYALDNLALMKRFITKYRHWDQPFNAQRIIHTICPEIGNICDVSPHLRLRTLMRRITKPKEGAFRRFGGSPKGEYFRIAKISERESSLKAYGNSVATFLLIPDAFKCNAAIE